MHRKNSIEHFMHPLHHYFSIREEAMVEAALSLHSSAVRAGKMPYLVVTGTDRHGRESVTGFLSSRELVFGIADHFLKGARKVGPIFWEGLLEAEMPAAVSRRVCEIMAPVPVCIGSTRDILEAVFAFNKHCVSCLPVLQHQEVIGILHLEDVLNSFVRIMHGAEGMESHADARGPSPPAGKK